MAQGGRGALLTLAWRLYGTGRGTAPGGGWLVTRAQHLGASARPLTSAAPEQQIEDAYEGLEATHEHLDGLVRRAPLQARVMSQVPRTFTVMT